MGVCMNIFDKISEKLSSKTTKTNSSYVSKPDSCNNFMSENLFLNKLSTHALNLYEKKCDIKNFTKLVLSDPENTSHNKMVEDLFKDKVLDPLEEKILKELSCNEALRRDLGL